MVPTVSIAARVRQQRRAFRQQLGRLGNLGATATRLCLAFAEPNEKAGGDLGNQLSAYIETLCEEGEPQSWASNCLSRVQFFFPSAKSHLHGSWSLVKAWQRTELPVRATPLTRDILFGTAGLAIAVGTEATCNVFGSFILGSFILGCGHITAPGSEIGTATTALALTSA